MPMTPTTAPAAKRALIALLRARDGLEGVQVVYGYLNDSAQLQDDNINVGKVRFSQEWGALGNRRREEKYRIELIIVVKREGDDQQATEERMWDVLAEVETALREDPRLGDAVQVAELVEGEQDNWPDGGGWNSQMVAQVACTASLPFS